MQPSRAATAVHHLAVLTLIAGAAALSSLACALAWRGGYGLHSLARWRYAMLVGAEAACALVGWAAALERVLAWRRGRWRSTSGAPLRIALYLFAAGVALELALFQPFHQFFLLLRLGLQAGVVAAALWFQLRGARIRPAGLARGLDRACLAACVAWLGVEGGLRLAGRFTGSALLDTGTVAAEANLRRQRFAPGRPFLGMPVDSRGFHDEELARAAGVRLVVAVGDSFSVGIVPHAFHYTTVAERGLERVEIYNAGAPAIGPAEYELLLERELLPLEPDLVLLAVFVGNDLIEAKRARPSWRWARSLYDRERSLVIEVPARLARLVRERGRGNVDDTDWSDEVLLERTPEALLACYPWLADPEAERPTFTRESFLAIEAYRAREICDPARDEVYPVFFSVLAQIVQRVAPTRLAVMLIPDEFQVEDGLWEQVRAHSSVRGALERDMPQRRIRAWLDERRVACLDLLPALRRVAPLADGDRHLYALRDTHFNARGNRVVGEELAEFLAGRLE